MIANSRAELGLTSIAWMANFVRHNVKVSERKLRILPDGDHRFRFQRLQQPHEHRSARLTLTTSMAAVRHWIVSGVWVERKDVPEENWTLKLI
jgi:1-deoxy-D-xylulose 5-phosphate reductoisomerase